jgi:pimeloyl-ACP methyl ester carboxylesterase
VPVRGIRLHVREWAGAAARPPFVLVHGLASNLRTWEAVAEELAERGHRVVAVDQRGHGRSDKPATGYGFDEVTADLLALLDALDLRDGPIIAGQSWGGNVVLDFAARYPGVATGYVLVDGGFLELSSRPGMTWERVSVELRPPPLAGTPLVDLRERMRQGRPDWSEAGIERTLANFEVLPDGTVRPWLSLERHLEILRALWEHRPSQLYARVEEPVLLCPAGHGDPERVARKREGVERAAATLPRGRVRWFDDADHDVHVHRPRELAEAILEALTEGFYDRRVR